MKKYHYINDDGKECYDFCDSCERKIKQKDLGNGAYGCEFCGGTNSINNYVVEK